MPYEILHFRGSDKILTEKNMDEDIQTTFEYISESLNGTLHKGELLRQALDDMGWRSGDNGYLKIFENRRYTYKGFKRNVAIEGSFSFYEFILEGLFRLQIGYDKGLIETGILLLNSRRSERSPYGSTSKMVKEEIDMLEPTISMPVSVGLFDLGEPMILQLKGGEQNGVPVPEDEQESLG